MSTDCVESTDDIVEAKSLSIELLDPADAQYQRIITATISVPYGRVTGLVGASGSGKSTLALAFSGLLPASARMKASSLRVEQREYFADRKPNLHLSGRQFCERFDQQRRSTVMYVSQLARASLVPNRTIKWHLELARNSSRNNGSAGADSGAIETSESLLARYFHGDQRRASRTLGKYPGQMSTGECQRVLFAMAMLRRPPLLIADEPFASLDPKTADNLIQEIRDFVNSGSALLLVSHQWQLFDALTDLGDGYVAAGGELVDRLPLDALLHGGPRTLETVRLFHYSDHRFVSSADTQPLTRSGPIIEVRRLAASIGQRGLFDEQTMSIETGECCGVYGENGAGKTTLARILVGLHRADRGEVHRLNDPKFSGQLTMKMCRQLWKRIQLVYQDTDLVFDPYETLANGLIRGIRGSDRQLSLTQAWQRSMEQFTALGLPAKALKSPPARLSGGERKRAAIARALAILLLPESSSLPRLLILDEPTVGLDTFHQGLLAEYLRKVQQKISLSIIAISHDHGFIDRFCDRRIAWPISRSLQAQSPPSDEKCE